MDGIITDRTAKWRVGLGAVGLPVLGDHGASRDAAEQNTRAALTSLLPRQIEHLRQRVRDHIELLWLKSRQGALDQPLTCATRAHSSFGSAVEPVDVGVRVADDRQPGRHSTADVTGTMPRLCRGVDDVALVGNEDGGIIHLNSFWPSSMNQNSGPVRWKRRKERRGERSGSLAGVDDRAREPPTELGCNGRRIWHTNRQTVHLEDASRPASSSATGVKTVPAMPAGSSTTCGPGSARRRCSWTSRTSKPAPTSWTSCSAPSVPATCCSPVMGREWLTCTDRNGRRWLDDPHDFIRLEIGIALTRNVRVIPVLVEGAVMPTASELPSDSKGSPDDRPSSCATPDGTRTSKA